LPAHVVLLTGIAGLLAGALSMAAGEYVSVRSQLELLDATAPNAYARDSLPAVDVNANELALVYRARGMSAQEAQAYADEVLAGRVAPEVSTKPVDNSPIGSASAAALSSFLFFATGAVVAVLPYIFGASGIPAVVIAAGLVGLALLGTGSIVGLLSGASPLKRALRQLAIGFGAAGATYLLGLVFGVGLAN
jgi:VIT1/CCC1 family predicted Fe2+/Mn2+ transporter